ncbi:MAG: tetratricopeptide repeat protein [Acidobacteriia bacterium]|nr:tetratricopeptide repeat protein [Terriglobia bacterium]
MPILSSEIHFRKGLAALSEGNPAEAVEQFRQAIVIERQRSVSRPQMRYVSFYGLALARANGATAEAVQTCERAAKLDFCNPDLLLNLGQVYLLAGKTTRALMAFERGLRLAPEHGRLRAALAEVDRRGTPPLPFLRRSHAMNRWLGKLRRATLSRIPLKPPPRRTVTPS